MIGEVVQMRARESDVKQIASLFRDQGPGAARSRYVTDSRAQLEVEMICKPIPYAFQNSAHKYMYGIELKLGLKRLYVVQRIRELLEAIARGECYELSRTFSYDPQLHSFSSAVDATVHHLIEVYRNEQMYRETSALYSGHVANRVSGDRVLLIPPMAWETLLPLLVRASASGAVKLEVDGSTYTGMQVTDEAIPVAYQFGEAAQEGEDGYQLRIQGLDKLIVMDAYDQLLIDGRIRKLSTAQCKQLAELQAILVRADQEEVRIPAEQMSPFMDQVLPSLMKLGEVQITESISERILRTELQARMYLDRVRDRLLVGLEFQYGDIVINPLEHEERRPAESRILIRDGEKEAHIAALIEQCPFAKTEGGYFMEDEDSEFEFLYEVMPQLEKLLKVYATSAVKVRLAGGDLEPPKVNVEVDERTDWLEVKFQMDGIAESEIRKLLQSLEAKRRYHRLPSGAFVPLETAAFQEIIRFMNEAGVRKADLGIERGGAAGLRIPLVRALGLEVPLGGNGVGAVKLNRTLRQLLTNLRNPDQLDFPVPAGLQEVLRDYQRYGYQWMRTLAFYQFGGILADDMGLGKTVQAITFLVSMLPEIREAGKPAIIVAPSSLMYNWRNEFRKFAPEVRVVIADGTSSQRRQIWKNAAQVDVVITSYPLLRMDHELFTGTEFHTLILDEAQYFKNHTTQTARAVKVVRARYRFALTGTPIENRLDELWSIYGAVFPALFPDGRQAFHDLTREQVAARIRPFLLRRLKSDVLSELPEKIETLQASELLPEQKKLYLAYLAKLQQDTLKHLDKDTRDQNRIRMLAGLTRLRQLCCHPVLFSEGYTGSSAKFEQLLEIIEECRSAGRRALIFSQFTEMLGIIRRELGALGVPFFYLDGQTPSAERVQLCDRFNDGERDLFLISLKAGGTGLNLTGADTVILYDLWWNPAVEQQAADRAHRIGQKKVVQVIRLVAQGTIEDKMVELQARKLDLIDEVIGSGQGSLSSLTEEDLRELLGIG
jgi:superfamily II DNA or RNA helicase